MRLAMAAVPLAGILTCRRRKDTSSHTNFLGARTRLGSQKVVDRGTRSVAGRRGGDRVAMSATLMAEWTKEETTLRDLQVRCTHVRQVQMGTKATLGGGGGGGCDGWGGCCGGGGCRGRCCGFLACGRCSCGQLDQDSHNDDEARAWEHCGGCEFQVDGRGRQVRTACCERKKVDVMKKRDQISISGDGMSQPADCLLEDYVIDLKNMPPKS